MSYIKDTAFYAKSIRSGILYPFTWSFEDEMVIYLEDGTTILGNEIEYDIVNMAFLTAEPL